VLTTLAASRSSAVLLVDFQVGVTGMLGARTVPERAAAVAAAARSAGVPVVHVRTAFRPGYPEVSPRNRLFSGIKAGGRFLDGAADTAFDEAVLPAEGEVVVDKKRIDSFHGTELDFVLGGLGVDTIVLCGVLTSGAVLSAVRSAANRDLRVLVVSDACGDGNPDVHDMLTTRVFPMTAEVVTSEALLADG
jgi:nicotinamidase-related amidase